MRTFTRLVVAVGVSTALLTPATSDAQTGPNPVETERRLGEVRAQRGQVDLEVSALTAQDAQLQAALDVLESNVATQHAELDEAERAVEEADAAVVEATAAVQSQQSRIVMLGMATDAVVVDAYMNPAANTGLDAFREADSLSDVAVKQAIIEMSANADADLMDQLEQAQEDLEVDEANKEVAAADAEDRRAEADAQLTELQNALAQQQAFAADVEARLNAKLAEAESLRTFDAALADQLVREQEALAAWVRGLQEAAERQRQADAAAAARAAAASRPAPSPRSGGGGGGGGAAAPAPAAPAAQADPAPAVILPAPGGLATVTCPFGGSITVAGSIAGNVQGLLNAAASAGVSLCASSGYRSPDAQISLRQQNCGTSNYAIYYAPPSACNPPTAIPGSSMHERGLAVDFSCNGGGAIRRGNECWNFLAAHADEYGLHNLPGEDWHWSTNGR
ncbi:MAG TPA: D-alanyl-D-alanine carboxypeptidase family protein [Acidimicrobiales bacterium]|nr:D-alanyl-D-alanine carboxypeptidase family protein [Acidimicrobiales bacterium]